MGEGAERTQEPGARQESTRHGWLLYIWTHRSCSYLHMYSTVRPMGKQSFFVRGCVRMRARVSSLKDVLGLFAGGKFFQIKTKENYTEIKPIWSPLWRGRSSQGPTLAWRRYWPWRLLRESHFSLELGHWRVPPLSRGGPHTYVHREGTNWTQWV